MVVDVDRRPGACVEQAIPVAANQTKLVAGWMGSDDPGGSPLDAFNDGCSVIVHVVKYNVIVIFGNI